jgi:Na+/proline symporter
MELTSLDYSLIALYFLILIIIGIIVNRKESNEDFLISSRKLKLFSSISTINASKTGAIIMAYTAMVFHFGFSAAWYFIGTFIGFLVFIPFASKLYDQSDKKQYTLAEYFYKNYNKLTGQLSNILVIIIMVGFL